MDPNDLDESVVESLVKTLLLPPDLSPPSRASHSSSSTTSSTSTSTKSTSSHKSRSITLLRTLILPSTEFIFPALSPVDRFGKGRKVLFVMNSARMGMDSVLEGIKSGFEKLGYEFEFEEGGEEGGNGWSLKIVSIEELEGPSSATSPSNSSRTPLDSSTKIDNPLTSSSSTSSSSTSFQSVTATATQSSTATSSSDDEGPLPHPYSQHVLSTSSPEHQSIQRKSYQIEIEWNFQILLPRNSRIFRTSEKKEGWKVELIKLEREIKLEFDSELPKGVLTTSPETISAGRFGSEEGEEGGMGKAKGKCKGKEKDVEKIWLKKVVYGSEDDYYFCSSQSKNKSLLLKVLEALPGFGLVILLSHFIISLLVSPLYLLLNFFLEDPYKQLLKPKSIKSKVKSNATRRRSRSTSTSTSTSISGPGLGIDTLRKVYEEDKYVEEILKEREREEYWDDAMSDSTSVSTFNATGPNSTDKFTSPFKPFFNSLKTTSNSHTTSNTLFEKISQSLFDSFDLLKYSIWSTKEFIEGSLKEVGLVFDGVREVVRIMTVGIYSIFGGKGVAREVEEETSASWRRKREGKGKGKMRRFDEDYVETTEEDVDNSPRHQRHFRSHSKNATPLPSALSNSTTSNPSTSPSLNQSQGFGKKKNVQFLGEDSEFGPATSGNPKLVRKASPYPSMSGDGMGKSSGSRGKIPAAFREEIPGPVEEEEVVSREAPEETVEIKKVAEEGTGATGMVTGDESPITPRRPSIVEGIIDETSPKPPKPSIPTTSDGIDSPPVSPAFSNLSPTSMKKKQGWVDGSFKMTSMKGKDSEEENVGALGIEVTQKVVSESRSREPSNTSTITPSSPDTVQPSSPKSTHPLSPKVTPFTPASPELAGAFSPLTNTSPLFSPALPRSSSASSDLTSPATSTNPNDSAPPSYFTATQSGTFDSGVATGNYGAAQVGIGMERRSSYGEPGKDDWSGGPTSSPMIRQTSSPLASPPFSSTSPSPVVSPLPQSTSPETQSRGAPGWSKRVQVSRTTSPQATQSATNPSTSPRTTQSSRLATTSRSPRSAQNAPLPPASAPVADPGEPSTSQVDSAEPTILKASEAATWEEAAAAAGAEIEVKPKKKKWKKKGRKSGQVQQGQGGGVAGVGGSMA